MKKKRITFKLAALAAMALLCCSTIFISTGAWAQCPTSPPDCPSPPNPGFTYHCYSTNILMSSGCHKGTSCAATICYCYRNGCGTFNDFFIESITIDNDCLCGETDAQLIKDAMKQIIADNPQHLPCNPCPPGSIDWRMFRGSCSISWVIDTVVQGTTIHTHYTNICSGGGWCWDVYKVCCVNNKFTGTLINSYSLSGTCSGCPTPPSGAYNIQYGEGCQ